MNLTTGIEWTDATSNPLKYRDKETGKTVWACVKKSAGCANCYSEALANRYSRGGPFVRSEMDKVEPFLCPDELCHLLRAPKLAGKRCFVGDMTDVFGEWVSDDLIDTLLAALALRRDATFQVLTKRADRLAAYMRVPDRKQRIAARAMDLSNLLAAKFRTHTARIKLDDMSAAFKGSGPLRNVWFGASVENQDNDPRIEELLSVPAAVRFLSCEPLIGALDLPLTAKADCNRCVGDCGCDPGIHWVIVGGESGPGCRPCRPEWVRSIVEQCRAAGVPVFVKQMGGNVVTRNDMIVDGFNDANGWPDPDVEHDIHGFRENYQGADCRIRLADRKGGDMAEWPADLRVREFPTTTQDPTRS